MNRFTGGLINKDGWRNFVGVLAMIGGFALLSPLFAQSGQERAQPCVGWRYTLTKAIPHPGIETETTVCATFRNLTVVGEDYDRFHFEKALREGGFTFSAPVWSAK